MIPRPNWTDETAGQESNEEFFYRGEVLHVERGRREHVADAAVVLQPPQLGRREFRHSLLLCSEGKQDKKHRVIAAAAAKDNWLM